VLSINYLTVFGVEVVDQGLAPSMQHADESDLAVQAPAGIGGEEQVQTELAVVKHQGVQQVRNGEDQVEVAAGQELRSASGQVIVDMAVKDFGHLGALPVATLRNFGFRPTSIQLILYN